MRGLTQEQTTKLKSYQSNKEILKLAKERGAELTDGQLEAVNRGNCKHIRTFVKKCLMKDGEVIVGMTTSFRISFL